MDVFEAITARHMCREFSPDREVPEKQIEQLVEVGGKAPSAGGLEDRHFTVIQEKKTLKALEASAPSQRFRFSDASAMIVVSSDLEIVAAKYGERGRNLYAPQNCAAAVENILLAAIALGLGACWVGAFDEETAKQILDLPNNVRPMVLIPIGYKQ